MSGWRTCPLGDVLTLQRGFDITKAEQREGIVPVVSSSGINSYHDEAKVAGPGVVIGRKGSLGTCFYLRTSFWPHDTTLWVKDFKGNNPKFCYFLLQWMALAQHDVGAANPTLNRNHVHLIPVRVPDVVEQERIADILSAYDDLIEVNRRRIAVLEEMASGLFTEWFTRLRFPGHEDVPIEDTPDGPLPAGWSWTQLGSLIALIYGKALKADTRQPGDVAVIGSSGVVGSHNAALVSGPGIAVGRKGNVGSVIWSSGDFWPIDTAYYVDTKLPLPYIYQLLKRIPFQNTDAAVPGLNRDYALSRMVLAASGALVQRYADFAAPIHDAVTGLEQANANITVARDLLLPRLISGQLSVTQAELEPEAA